jgi:CheY-like chemotaxis protein
MFATMNDCGTILHVEDDPNDVLLVQYACRRLAVKPRVETVANGEEAIAYLKGEDPFSNRERHPLPQLVLLDLKMPRVNGFEVLQWIRQQEQFRRTPVIVLSSSNHATDVKRAYDMGANSYLVKPIHFEGLVEVLGSTCHYWLTLNHFAEA